METILKRERLDVDYNTSNGSMIMKWNDSITFINRLWFVLVITNIITTPYCQGVLIFVYVSV